MDNSRSNRASNAEWILRPIVGRDRASAIIGDLLESHPGYGRFHFSVAVLALAVSLTGRTVVGVLLATITAVCCSWMPSVYVFMKVPPQYTQAAQGNVRFFLMLTFVCLAAATFAVVKFGMLHRLTLVSSAAALLASATMLTRWMDGAPSILSLILTAFLISCITFPAIRRAAAALIAAMTVGSAALWIGDKIPIHPNSLFHGWMLAGWIFMNFSLTVTLECKALMYVYDKLAKGERAQTQKAIAE